VDLQFVRFRVRFGLIILVCNKLMSIEEDEIGFENEPTKLGGTIVVLLCIVSILGTIGFGLVDSWGLAFLSAFLFAIVILWSLNALKKGAFSFSKSSLQIPVCGLILIGLIQLLPIFNANLPADLLSIPTVSSISLDPIATRSFVGYLTAYLLFFAAALTFLDSSKRLKIVAIAIIIFGTIMAFFAIIQRLANVESLYGIRALNQAVGFGSFVNQHHFAALMEMILALTGGVLLNSTLKKEQRFLLIFSLVLMLIAVFFTGSRGGMLSLIGIAGFFLFAKYRFNAFDEQSLTNSKKLSFVIGIISIIFFIVFATFFLGGDASLIRGVGLSEMTQADFSSGRLDFWKVALQIFIHNPIFGSGLDSFPVVMSRYDQWNGTFRIEQAHNEYLQVLAEAGILGLACVFGFIYLLFKKGISNIKMSNDRFSGGVALGALAGCLGIFIHSFFDFPLRTPSNGLIFLLLAALATVRFSHQNSISL
jgi:O-antigen ligase